VYWQKKGGKRKERGGNSGGGKGKWEDSPVGVHRLVKEKRKGEYNLDKKEKGLKCTPKGGRC